MRDLEIIVANFAGWSIRMSDEAVGTWQPYLEGRGVYDDEKTFADVRARIHAGSHCPVCSRSRARL